MRDEARIFEHPFEGVLRRQHAGFEVRLGGPNRAEVRDEALENGKSLHAERLPIL
jgi:hypothetical protein